MKLQHTILLLSLSFIISGCMHQYNPNSVAHQNIQAATALKTGMSADEVQRIMGEEPIKVHAEGNTAVWQYCDTQYDQSNYVALFFSVDSNLLDKINYYTIFWKETEDYVYHSDGVPFFMHEGQRDCHHFAQDMGVKIPGKIDFYTTQKDRDDEMERRWRWHEAARTQFNNINNTGGAIIGPRSPDGHCCR